jgi:hypothetical protein
MIKIEEVTTSAKKGRAPYRGGKTTEALQPWLKEDPPMSRATWYRLKAKAKERDKTVDRVSLTR